MYLDEKLNYNTHIKEKLSKVYKGIGLLRNVSNKLPRQALVTIYKAFIKPHLDYGDIVYDKPDNETFINKIEKAQYDAALAVTGAIRGTSREKLYAELGIESLKFRRWFRKLACFYKIQSTELPKYLLQLIPNNNHHYILRKPLDILHYYCRTNTSEFIQITQLARKIPGTSPEAPLKVLTADLQGTFRRLLGDQHKN